MNILIIGASSAIATATARLYAQKYKANFFLVARDEARLSALADDLKVRGATAVTIKVTDFTDDAAYPQWIEEAFTAYKTIDVTLIAHGILGDQEACEKDVNKMKEMMFINGFSPLAMLTELANRYEKQGSGTIAFVSSVAGDRGRSSNYVYGASKAVVTTFLQGLRVRMAKLGVQVLTIKPGFVDTPMTADIDKSGPLWAKPEDIAVGIEKAIVKGKHEVYLPFFWRYIMGIIMHIPHFVFNKLSL
ncbi:MAG: SDR family oxidoreductase [Pseudomonadales bacterium]|nr:SDR family oxidoreductase [Pseudomonadales bacterium]